MRGRADRNKVFRAVHPAGKFLFRKVSLDESKVAGAIPQPPKELFCISHTHLDVDIRPGVQKPGKRSGDDEFSDGCRDAEPIGSNAGTGMQERIF